MEALVILGLLVGVAVLFHVRSIRSTPPKPVEKFAREFKQPPLRRKGLAKAPRPRVGTLKGTCHVIDGDTIVISGTHVRLAGIDAPELNHPWGQKSKWAVINMCKGQVVCAHIKPEKSYDRIVATCYLPDGRDIAAELVRLGLALDWPKFSGGKYAHLEPEGIRKKLWRAAAKQRGAYSLERHG